jgi:hypothetical protein
MARTANKKQLIYTYRKCVFIYTSLQTGYSKTRLKKKTRLNAGLLLKARDNFK